MRHRGTENSIQSFLADLRAVREHFTYAAVLPVEIKAAFDSLDWRHLMCELNKHEFP